MSGKSLIQVAAAVQKLLSPPVATSCDVVKDGLVACYPFDGDVKDYSGNGLHGQTYGVTLAEDRFGNPNAAYQFYGNVNSYIEVQDHSLLDLTSSFSFSLWIKQSGAQVATGYRLIDKITSCAGDGYLLDTFDATTGRKMRFFTRDYYLSSLSQTAYSLNEWHHLVLTFANGTHQFYLDGVPNGTGSDSPAVTNNLALLFGKAHPGNCQGKLGGLMENFLGFMDDIRIYNRALSETEIKQLYGKETLTITKTSNGNVTATGINCGTDCTENYAKDSTVALTAVPIAYATFTGWSGDCTGTGTTVNVTMDKAKSCAANFSSTLTNPANGHAYQFINWGMGWQNGVNHCASQGGYLVTITSQSEQDFVFNNLCAGKSMCLLGGWQERRPRGWRWITGEAWTYSRWKPNNGDGDAPVVGMYGVMGSAKSAYPSFWNDFEKTDVGFPICEWNSPMMTLTVAKTGNGKVTGQGVNCGTDCAENYAKGSSVTLTAVPVTGATFTGWSGDCTGTATTVNLTMDKAKSCVATFSATITNSANGHTYQLINQGMTWSQGKDYCASKGGYLATITSQVEQNFVYSNLCVGNSVCLLGGTNDGQAGKWRWITNEPWGYTHWGNGGPDNYLGKETVMMMFGENMPQYGGVASFWNDFTVADGGLPVCEWDAPKVTLTIAKTGNGQVTGNGITCGTDCTEDLAPNTPVTLTATATTGSIFKQWTGDCTGTTATVTLTLDQAKTCTATFVEIKYPLTVATTGNGTVTGSGDYLPNTQVTLTATPATGYTFKDWTGDCTGTTSPLTVTMDKAKTCGATFELLPTGLPLTVNKADYDRGRITGRLRGATTASLTCASACPTASYNYPKDGVVIVTATAEKGFEFKTWTCTGSSYTQDPAKPNILKVTMTTETTCTANFDAIPGQLFSLTVNLIGTGMGSVTPSKAGLECQGSQCTGVYAKDTRLTLTAKPNAFSNFLNWGGDCTGNSLKVSVTLTKDLTCSAQFQSMLEAAATELVEVLYTDGFLENNTDVASQFSQATNQDRLKEAFWLAATAILQADANLTATQQWPAQLNDIPWYSKNPIGQYTESIQFQADDYVDIRLKLLDNAGVEQEAMIVIYYGDTPPIPVGDSSSGRIMIPIYVPSSWLRAWNSRPR